MRAYLGLGANIGDAKRAIEAVPPALTSRSILITNASRVFQTEPVGGPPGQPDFLNQVLEIRTMCTPREVLDACRAIEFAFGRDRPREEPNGPRTLDIDVLAIQEQVVNEPDFVVPHPRLHERSFVLVPLAEVAPDLEIPGRGTVAALLMALGDTSGVRPVG